ncbi:hypothetical protein [Paenibacillus sp. GCM10023250]|uniref:hypothetical protein n=1 Tax=Paenibacillus sp. GCM10023250 TaxID=3252648 RepID=UPI0036091AE0
MEAASHRRKKVAAIVTEYRLNAHAEVIIGRLLGKLGYRPQVEVSALYLDQMPPNDLGLAEASAAGVPVVRTIAEAITSDTDAVLLIGEHGDYPWNAKRQKLYPRRRFFEETFRALDRLQLRVPIFNDKHLACGINDADWIYQGLRARALPFLGGSSIPHVPHVPRIDRSLLAAPSAIFVISWLGIESYGYHGMEVLQSLAEQRDGGETGIVSVQALEGRAVWSAMDRGEVPEELMLSALGAASEELPGHPRDHVDVPVLFIIDYADGLKGYVLQLQRFVREWTFAIRDREGHIASARCDSDQERPYRHFETLTRLIEQTVLTGASPVPLERTYLTSQMINFGMESLAAGKPMETPRLRLRY